MPEAVLLAKRLRKSRKLGAVKRTYQHYCVDWCLLLSFAYHYDRRKWVIAGT